MNRIRSLAIGAMLMFALMAVAQQATTANSAKRDVPAVEEHMRLLTAKLDLTADQETKMKPMIREMHDATEKVVDDASLSREERRARIRVIRSKADRDVREVLNDEQKKKLDQMEQESPEMHDDMNRMTPPAQSPQN
jgi:Spy/CpxP family protein refolding chaperone